MSKLSAITVPNKILAKATFKVASFDENLRDQVGRMRQFLSTQDGIGLAANQIGLENQVLIVEFQDPQGKETIPFQVFVNPKIAELSIEKEILDEGCLSIPKIELPVERSLKIKLRAKDLSGKNFRLSAKGLLARIIQHEIDHLNGIVFTDRVCQKYHSDFPELKNLNIVFIGSGDFAVPILEGLILLGLNLKIITEKAKVSGRNKVLRKTPVSELSEKFGKSAIETGDVSKNLKDFEDADILICADFGQKIPQNILNLPKQGAFNIHPSLLPKYRGATPIPSAILAGEKETGVSIISMTDKIDQGPILGQITTKIAPADTSLTLESGLSTLALKLLYEILPKIVRDELEAVPQNETEATFTKKLEKADGEIDWEKSPEEIDRQIRAYYPWPGSYTFLEGKRLIIHQAHLSVGKLIVDLVQLEGAKPMTVPEFIKGWRGPVPLWLGGKK